MLRKEWERIGTLVVIGGDTAAAIVGDDALECMGTVAPGIPASMYSGVCLITKGGGIGELEIVKTIVHETDAGQLTDTLAQRAALARRPALGGVLVPGEGCGRCV